MDSPIVPVIPTNSISVSSISESPYQYMLSDTFVARNYSLSLQRSPLEIPPNFIWQLHQGTWAFFYLGGLSPYHFPPQSNAVSTPCHLLSFTRSGAILHLVLRVIYKGGY